MRLYMEYAKSDTSYRELAAKFGMSHTTLYRRVQRGATINKRVESMERLLADLRHRKRMIAQRMRKTKRRLEFAKGIVARSHAQKATS